jgi:hypothetical protein
LLLDLQIILRSENVLIQKGRTLVRWYRTKMQDAPDHMSTHEMPLLLKETGSLNLENCRRLMLF